MATTERDAAITLTLRRTFPAPPARVWRAWTTSDEIAQWAAPGEMTVALAEADVRVGGRYRTHMRAPDGSEHHVTGRYLEVTPPHRLAYTWQWETGAAAAETHVLVEFRAAPGGTEVVLTHSRFASNDERGRHEQGWIGCLDKLAALLPA